MSVEKFSNQNQLNQEGWSQIEEAIKQKEKQIIKKKNLIKIKDLNLKNSAIKKNLKRFTSEREKNNKQENEWTPKGGTWWKNLARTFIDLNYDLENLPKGAEELMLLKAENLVEALREHKNKQYKIILDEICLQKVIQFIRESDVRAISTRNEITDGLVDEMNKLKKEQEELKQISPEAYIGLTLSNFKEQIQRTKRGMLVETNYVKEKKESTLKAMKAGKHMFLHGHLGGGKTDFAIDVSIDRMIDLNVKKELDMWLEKNPNAKEMDIIKTYKNIKKKYEIGVKNEDPKIMEKVRPFLVSGSKDFSLKDLYVEKTLKVTKFNGKEISEHLKSIDEEYEKWVKDNKEELSKLSKEEKARKEAEEAHRILEIYKMKNTGFGTMVKEIRKELLRAVEEGKPIIIDEVNSIPPTLLISMNDILTKKPGEKAYIPGVGSIEVKEGFNIIMTGNLETGGVAEYFGTEEMNPAFLSRVIPQEYNYLPQNKNGNVFEQENPEQNELFQTIITFLADKDGSLKLPEGSIDKLFKLAQLAKITQDVFSGRWNENDVIKTKSGDEIEPKLEKTVLSIRNIINVLEEWNKGQEIDLDMALWKAFISQATIPSDQDYILKQAARYGFFQENDGWNLQSFEETKNINLISEKDIKKSKYKYTRPNNHIYTPSDTVQILYGKAPERIKFPDINLEVFAEKEISIEKMEEFDQFENEINKYEKAFETFLKKEGCRLR